MFIRLSPYLLLVFLLSSCGGSQRISHSDRSPTISNKHKTVPQSDIVQLASQQKGKKYKYGGTAPKEGFDCSGLIYYCYTNNNIFVSRTSASLAQEGKKIPLSQVQPGDLLFFKNKGRINHVALVSCVSGKNIRAIHSTSSRGVIEEEIMNSSYWNPRFTFARSLL